MGEAVAVGLFILIGLAFAGARGSTTTIVTPGGEVTVKDEPGGGKLYTPKGAGGTSSTSVPAGWRWQGNQLWVSPNCDAVAEGGGFAPADKTIAALEATTLAASMQLKSAPDLAHPDNSVYGFLTYLIEQEGITHAGTLATRVLDEAAPHCKPNTLLPLLAYPPVLQAWHADFTQRISQRVDEIAKGIG